LTHPQLAQVDALLGKGALDAANNMLESMLQTAPRSRDLLLRLADIALIRKRPSAALSYADRLVDLDNADNDALFYKAKAELACGNTTAAWDLINRLEQLLGSQPAPFLLLKGSILAAKGDYPAAVEAFEAALGVDPNYARAYQSLDHVLRQRGNLPEARAVWKRRTALTPDAPSAWTKLAAVCSALAEIDEAQACLERAAALDPRNPGTWYALGSLHAERWKFDQAKHCLQQAVALDPGQDDYLSLLGWVSNELGDTSGALAALNPPGGPRISFSRGLRHALLLPQIYASREDLERWRQRYSEGLAAMHAALESACPSAAEIFNLNQTNFLLAYQGEDDLLLQSEYARLLRRLIVRAHPDLVEQDRPLGKRGGRMRVAFVSSFFRECPIGYYFRSWIERLDPARFEPMVIFTGGQPDVVTKAIAAVAETFVNHRGNPLEIASAILEWQPDILIYPEIGMHSTNYMLANMRLAPVQCAAWGHPVTTGSDLVDYYFTCSQMEPPGSRAHYAENLLYLPGLGTKYSLPRPAVENLSREAFSLPSDRHLFVCPQSLFKIHPDNDRLYLEILAADDKAVIVFFQSEFGQVTQSFADRITRAMVNQGMPGRNQIKFLPRLSTAAFRSVLALADAVLDTVHWSGGNTSLDALSAGAPIVTLPGNFMRGRQSKAMLEILGVPELIAADSKDYIVIALRLAADAQHKDAIRQRILANRGELFDRPEPVQALALHLERIYDSSR
jgi:protein O-GlcNAc transferase